MNSGLGEDDRPVIAVIAGPTATILNTPPFGNDPTVLVPQRVAEEVSIKVEAGSAHPLSSADSVGTAEAVVLHQGQMFALPMSSTDRAAEATFFPSAERLYEEIDQLCIDEAGRGRPLSRLASFEHFRAAPPAGFEEATPPEIRGVDFFPYGSWDTRAEPDIAALVRITNSVQEVMEAPRFAGAQWLEGSPVIEETLYWLALLIDTNKPIVGQVAQRTHRSLGSDGPQNLFDGVRYITSGAWNVNENGDEVGPVLIADGLVRSARGAYKVAGRPGGYVGGGPVATCTTQWPVRLEYIPTRRHTYKSELRMSAMPASVMAVDPDMGMRPVQVIGADGKLAPETLPVVDVVVYGRYGPESHCGRADLGVSETVQHNSDHHGLAGFVLEGIAPNGWASKPAEAALAHAVYAGFPVVWCGRGRPEDPVGRVPFPFLAGSDLSATKARMLLLACLLRFGAAPVASDPQAPTEAEREATAAYVERVQEVFNTH